MSRRLLQICVSPHNEAAVRDALANHASRWWKIGDAADRGFVTLSALALTRRVEPLTSALKEICADDEEFSVVILPTEGAILQADRLRGERRIIGGSRPATPLERFFSRDRLSTDELLDDIGDATEVNATYFISVITSALIAGLGMLGDQPAVVIGAMVIAPLLGPSIALSLAATTADATLARRAGRAAAIGIVGVLAVMLLVGLFVDVDPAVPELARRTQMTAADIVLALASGSAGVMAFSRSLSASLVGVMIAVSLVPPLAASGMLAGAGEWHLAASAALLFTTNFICINIAGIATFLLQGLPPRDWRVTTRLLILWGLALAAAMAAISVGFTISGRLF